MKLRELDSVVLLRDLPQYGLCRGDVGAVVAVTSPTRVEVEFVRVSGETHALADLDVADVRLMDGGDVPAVRGSSPTS